MNSEQLQKYLRQVVDQEIQFRASNQTYGDYKYKLECLGIPRQFAKPVEPGGKHDWVMPILIAILSVAWCVILRHVLPGFEDSGKVGFWGEIFICFKPLIYIVTVPLAVGYAVIGLTGSINEKKSYKRSVKEYKQKCREYAALVAEDKARVKREQAQIPALKQMVQVLDKQRCRQWDLLQEYYALNILHPEYHDLVPAATFLNYMEKGMCSSLHGHEGCYVLYEEQRRLGIIITQLADIQAKLDQVIRNQQYLIDAMESVKRSAWNISQRLDGMSAQMDGLIDEAQIQSYNMRQMAAEQRAMDDYVIMRDWVR